MDTLSWRLGNATSVANARRFSSRSVNILVACAGARATRGIEEEYDMSERYSETKTDS